jgi:hydrogenase maturation protease
MPAPILVIGIGNEYRSDDGVGLVVVRELRAKNLPGVLVTESSGDGAALMETLEAASAVIFIDAASSDAAPGTIYRFDTPTQPLPMGVSFHSTHAFGVAEAIGLAGALGQLPPCLIMYAVEGESFSAGVGLSPQVAEAAQRVVEQVMHEVRRLNCA